MRSHSIFILSIISLRALFPLGTSLANTTQGFPQSLHFAVEVALLASKSLVLVLHPFAFYHILLIWCFTCFSDTWRKILTVKLISYLLVGSYFWPWKKWFSEMAFSWGRGIQYWRKGKFFWGTRSNTPSISVTCVSNCDHPSSFPLVTLFLKKLH